MPEFTKEQLEAIKYKDGVCMTIAGPGSGKTTVVVNRVAHLVKNCHVPETNILVITFTKAAAKEMKDRYLRLTKEVDSKVWFGTFHSVFFTILKQAYHFTANNVISENDRYRLMKQIVREMKLTYEDEDEFVTDIFSEISFVKSEMIDIDFYYSKCCGEAVFRKIYMTYHSYLNKKHLIDFDDMLVLTYELLSERSDILNGWSKRFEYIMIDEFQDINKIQYEIVKLLMKRHGNLFVVGDDDQSIYGFRGSKPEYMVRFREVFRDASVITLKDNFRSTKEIVSMSDCLIRNNTDRLKKDYISKVGSLAEPVHIHDCKSGKEQSLHIIHMIDYYKKQGISLDDIAIISRTNIEPRNAAYKMMEYGIPFSISDSIPGLYQHFIAKDILSYIRLARGEFRREDVLRIINKPLRYIKRDYIYMDPVDFDVVMDLLDDDEKPWLKKRIVEFIEQLHMLNKLPPAGAINYICKVIGYEEYISDYAKEHMLSYEDFQAVISEIAEDASNYKNHLDWFVGIEEQIEKQKLLANKKDKDGVQILSMHGAKGLEFSVVFVIDVNEGYLPHRKSKKLSEIEEERRLFYVAMTRSKKYLHIYSVRELHGRNLAVSRFLDDISR